MATAPINGVIQHFRRILFCQDGAARTDGQLLEAFITQKDEAAFAALVRRHGPMVLAVCRRVVGNHHDAEDAFQATFLVLSRKASSVRPRERVAGFLHGVAYRTALKARTTTARRRVREKQVTEMPEPAVTPQDPWFDLQPLLDQELNGLPEKYRLPILLCDLEGRSIKEATEQLGWPQGTVAGRLARGRKMLAKRLTRRGLVFSGGSLAAVLARNAASAAVPASLLGVTVNATSFGVGGNPAGTIPDTVAALTQGVLKAMFLTKVKLVLGVLLATAALSGAVGLIYQTQATEKPDKNKLTAEKDERPELDRNRQPEAEKPSEEVVPGQTPEDYGRIFEAVLEVISERFDICYANRYEGRIETFPRQDRPAQPLKSLRRRAIVLITPIEEGHLLVSVRVFKESPCKSAEETSLGRDTGMEQVLLQRMLDQEQQERRQKQRDCQRKKERTTGKHLGNGRQAASCSGISNCWTWTKTCERFLSWRLCEGSSSWTCRLPETPRSESSAAMRSRI